MTVSTLGPVEGYWDRVEVVRELREKVLGLGVIRG